MFKIISYYTKENGYEKIARDYLIPTLNRYELDYYIEAIDNLGNWNVNTRYKVKFIKRMLNKYKNPVVFLDVDAQILKYPKLFFELKGYDLALHYLNWAKNWKNRPSKRRDALSGTLYLDYNEKVLSFLDEWKVENTKDSRWEQQNMQAVLERRKDLKVYKLPYSYATIVNYDNKIPKHMISKDEVVILHNQKSREFKA